MHLKTAEILLQRILQPIELRVQFLNANDGPWAGMQPTTMVVTISPDGETVGIDPFSFIATGIEYETPAKARVWHGRNGPIYLSVLSRSMDASVVLTGAHVTFPKCAIVGFKPGGPF